MSASLARGTGLLAIASQLGVSAMLATNRLSLAAMGCTSLFVIV